MIHLMEYHTGVKKNEQIFCKKKKKKEKQGWISQMQSWLKKPDTRDHIPYDFM